MRLTRLIFREIAFRKLNFALSVLSIVVAAGCLVAELIMLRKYDERTSELIAAKEAETKKNMEKLEDDYRKITKNMGFNVLILPKDQNLNDLYADDFASKYMPESYGEKLAKSNVMTVNHVLPTLQQKLKWPERERTIVLIGTRGEAVVHNQKQSAMWEPVAPGTAILGYELHRSLKIKQGEPIKLLGRDFKVARCKPESGTKDDITIWINLKEAQELLDKKGLVNAILALECNCGSKDRLGEIRAEIAGILPDTQVIEFASQALARAEARNRATKEAQATVELERTNREKLLKEKEGLAAMIVPAIFIASGIWVGLLAFVNARERRNEIGILRALGLRSRHVLTVFVAKALLIGILGAALGYCAGAVAGAKFAEVNTGFAVYPDLLGVVLIAAPMLAAFASWIPAMLAAQTDPAVVLRDL